MDDLLSAAAARAAILDERAAQDGSTDVTAASPTLLRGREALEAARL